MTSIEQPTNRAVVSDLFVELEQTTEVETREVFMQRAIEYLNRITQVLQPNEQLRFQIEEDPKFDSIGITAELILDGEPHQLLDPLNNFTQPYIAAELAQVPPRDEVDILDRFTNIAESEAWLLGASCAVVMRKYPEKNPVLFAYMDEVHSARPVPIHRYNDLALKNPQLANLVEQYETTRELLREVDPDTPYVITWNSNCQIFETNHAD